MVFFLLIIAFYLGVNGWIYYSLFHIMGQWPLGLKIGASVVYWCLALSFFALQMFHKHLPISMGHVVYWVSTGWLAFFLYMALFLAATSLLKLAGVPIPHSFGISLGLTAVVLIAGFIHFTHPETKHLNIDLQKSSKEKRTMRVVAISDVHLGYGINKARLKNYVKAINNEHPDLIVIGGDLIDMSVRPLWGEEMYEELNQLHAPLGVYMVPGNHEFISGIKEASEFIQQTQITLLRDSVVTLPNGIQLAGRDDFSNRRRKTVHQLLQSTDKQAPVFVLDHQPHNEEVKAMIDEQIDFGFFGHTHHGQIWPLNWVTGAIYELGHGYLQKGNTHLYVSSGLGLWGPPFRIGSDSEMIVIDFTF